MDRKHWHTIVCFHITVIYSFFYCSKISVIGIELITADKCTLNWYIVSLEKNMALQWEYLYYLYKQQKSRKLKT